MKASIETPSRPSGDNRGDTAPVTASCKCGAGPHPELDDRCAAGHVLKGNGLAMVVSHRSAIFWCEHEQIRRELSEAVIRDSGHDPEDAPRALELAADGIAQAALVRDSAYQRMVEAGGPLTSAGRTRRAFNVWCAALDRTERHLRLLGLKREPKAVPSLEEVMAGE